MGVVLGNVLLQFTGCNGTVAGNQSFPSDTPARLSEEVGLITIRHTGSQRPASL